MFCDVNLMFILQRLIQFFEQLYYINIYIVNFYEVFIMFKSVSLVLWFSVLFVFDFILNFFEWLLVKFLCLEEENVLFVISELSCVY